MEEGGILPLTPRGGEGVDIWASGGGVSEREVEYERAGRPLDADRDVKGGFMPVAVTVMAC